MTLRDRINEDMKAALKAREADLQRKLRLLPGVIGVEVSIVEPEDSAININPYPFVTANNSSGIIATMRNGKMILFIR